MFAFVGGVADVELGVVCSDCGGAHQDAVVLCAELVGEHSGRGGGDGKACPLDASRGNGAVEGLGVGQGDERACGLGCGRR